MEEHDSRKMTVSQFVDKLFWILIMFFANQISHEAGSINKSIETLNERMAVVVTNVANNDRRLEKLDTRVYTLEGRHR